MSDTKKELQITLRQTARDVLTMAANGGMPDTYWHTDSRIQRACKVLGIGPNEARAWAYENMVDNS